MKKLLLLISCLGPLFMLFSSTHSSSRLQLDDHNYFEIDPYSLEKEDMVVIYYDQVSLDIYFNINMNNVNIKIENNNSDVVYYQKVDSELYSQFLIPVGSLQTGYYTIYLVNPYTGGYMKANFYKE